LAPPSEPETRSTDLRPDWHARRFNREKKIQGHIRLFQALGLDVSLTPASA